MASVEEKQVPKATAVEVSKIDVTLLAGRPVMLFCEQFPGKPMKAHVALANDHELFVCRSHSGQPIDNLVTNQKVVFRVTYKGQELSIPGLLKSADSNRYRVALGKKLMPLMRRQFTRITYTSPVTLATVSATTFRRSRLSRLRWLKTETVDISSGGTLIDFSTCLINPTFLLFHLETTEFSFPALLLARVLYSLPRENGSFHVGLEFIIREEYPRYFPPATIKELPAVAREYGDQKRLELNQEIQVWKEKHETTE